MYIVMEKWNCMGKYAGEDFTLKPFKNFIDAVDCLHTISFLSGSESHEARLYEMQDNKFITRHGKKGKVNYED